MNTIKVDTSEMTVSEVVERIREIIILSVGITLTYSAIQPMLFNKVKEYLNNK